MSFEDLEPQRVRGPLAELAREDLDLRSVEDCEERIAALEAEIARTRAAMTKKADQKSAADALFNFGR
ncbi:MAG TPA: DUF1192 domain-containing protein [Brevundimonas sp.]|uniref:DUF1192 domain-containing protein n=1 Tax=Brevundimonas sp. TaxID=1871086 RepID=UPI002DF20A2B|nr:DUF1192 domain-containing protein [Brevundimonas sp.]